MCPRVPARPQRQPQQRQTLVRQLVAKSPRVVQLVLRRAARRRQRIHHIRPQVRNHVRMRCQRLLQPLPRPFQPLLLHRVSGVLRLSQPAHHIRRHEHRALVLLPPAPPAIIMLEAVQPIQPSLHLIVQRLAVNRRFQLQLIHRLRHNHVWHEARHRLLCAAPRISRQVVQRVKHRPRHARRNCDGQPARPRIRPRRVAVAPRRLSVPAEDHP